MFLVPILSVGLAVVSFTRRHPLVWVTAAAHAATPWIAPPSIRSQAFFGYLVGFVVASTLLVAWGQLRQRR